MSMSRTAQTTAIRGMPQNNTNGVKLLSLTPKARNHRPIGHERKLHLIMTLEKEQSDMLLGKSLPGTSLEPLSQLWAKGQKMSATAFSFCVARKEELSRLNKSTYPT